MSQETRRIVQATLTLLGTGLAFYSLYALRIAWFMLFASIVIGTAASPLVQRFAGHTRSRLIAATLIYGGALVVVVGAGVLLWPFLTAQAQVVAERLPGDLSALYDRMSHSHNPLMQRLASSLLPLLSSSAPGSPKEVTASAIALLSSAASATFSGLLVLVVAFFWTVEGDLAVRALLHFLPAERRESTQRFVAAAELRVGGYIRGQLLMCLISAGLLCVGLGLLRLQYFLVLAAIAGTFELVPLFGPLAAGCLGIAIALGGGHGAGKVPWVMGIMFANHMLVNYAIAPRVMGKSVGVHPFVVLFSITAFGSLLGIAGALLAIPMAALLQLLLDRWLLHPEGRVDPGSRDRLALLKLRSDELARDVRKLAQNEARPRDYSEADERAEDIAETLAIDLGHLIDLAAREEARARSEAANSVNESVNEMGTVQ